MSSEAERRGEEEAAAAARATLRASATSVGKSSTILTKLDDNRREAVDRRAEEAAAAAAAAAAAKEAAAAAAAAAEAAAAEAAVAEAAAAESAAADSAEAAAAAAAAAVAKEVAAAAAAGAEAAAVESAAAESAAADSAEAAAAAEAVAAAEAAEAAATPPAETPVEAATDEGADAGAAAAAEAAAAEAAAAEAVAAAEAAAAAARAAVEAAEAERIRKEEAAAAARATLCASATSVGMHVGKSSTILTKLDDNRREAVDRRAGEARKVESDLLSSVEQLAQHQEKLAQELDEAQRNLARELKLTEERPATEEEMCKLRAATELVSKLRGARTRLSSIAARNIKLENELRALQRAGRRSTALPALSSAGKLRAVQRSFEGDRDLSAAALMRTSKSEQLLSTYGGRSRVRSPAASPARASGQTATEASLLPQLHTHQRDPSRAPKQTVMDHRFLPSIETAQERKSKRKVQRQQSATAPLNDDKNVDNLMDELSSSLQHHRVKGTLAVAAPNAVAAGGDAQAQAADDEPAAAVATNDVADATFRAAAPADSKDHKAADEAARYFQPYSKVLRRFVRATGGDPGIDIEKYVKNIRSGGATGSKIKRNYEELNAAAQARTALLEATKKMEEIRERELLEREQLEAQMELMINRQVALNFIGDLLPPRLRRPNHPVWKRYASPQPEPRVSLAGKAAQPNGPPAGNTALTPPSLPPSLLTGR